MLPGDQPIGVEQCNCFAVRKAARQISRLYDAHLHPTGLRITQFLILVVLKEQGGASVNSLAERLDIERTAMGKMIGVLERDGLVTVESSVADARSRVAEMTPKGKIRLDQATPLWRDAQNKLNKLIGIDEVMMMRLSHLSVKIDI